MRSVTNGYLEKKNPENTVNETKFLSYPLELTAIFYLKGMELTVDKMA